MSGMLSNEDVLAIVVGLAGLVTVVVIALISLRSGRSGSRGPTGTEKDPSRTNIYSDNLQEMETETFSPDEADRIRSELHLGPDGARLPQTCPRCLVENEPDSTFCERCGSALDQGRMRHQMGWRHGPVVLSVGRFPHNSIVIDNDSMVSSEHAQFWFSRGTLLVRDLHSTNGTFVNGVRIYDATMVVPGDEIHFGHTLVKFDVLMSALGGEIARLRMMQS